MSRSLLISAPGKVIVFGEHAVVHYQPAISASLSLRAYLLIKQPQDSYDTITLTFPDIDLDMTWKLADLPIGVVPDYGNDVPASLDQNIVKPLNALLTNLAGQPMKLKAAFVFLYLYCLLTKPFSRGGLFILRSTLPVGAGLGSSAAVSVSIAAGLLVLAGKIPQDAVSSPDLDTLKLINKYAFLGEIAIHGSPSGIDNTVATYGGAVKFQRVKSGTSSYEQIPNFPPLRLILTDTRIPKSTATLVAGVHTLIRDMPVMGNSLIEAIGRVSSEAYKLLSSPECDADERSQQLQTLFRINHGLLEGLGVSHPMLERIRLSSVENGVGETKLTGAGGGGCSITLVKPQADPANIEAFKTHVRDEYKSKAFDGSLGGPGVGFVVQTENTPASLFDSDLFCSFKCSEDIIDHFSVNDGAHWQYWC
ncbi:hypothetical protein CANCADRAFT_93700 [Tortispora caseinolytica NRRL Y-17796]|uniref:Mevalonate kinase n=1 Tax=Tortispora caseinolytica NRRL Y-17796 TaxID=767744 RepID=A0A1E4TM26_9ASCO|nr:hypothetical protein CANCADRAFT_93700 [Tortispora caseinolytica NRRL Y-17796]